MKAAQALAWAAPLWQFAVGQNIPSNPSAADFLSRRHAAVTVLNDHLYIVGGRFSSLVDGKIAMNGDLNHWQLNETLSLSLKESWNSSTVRIQALKQDAPSFDKAALWPGPDQKSAYWWGGYVLTGSPPTKKELWQFTADDEGGGAWRHADTANPDFLQRILRTAGASTAVCKEKALYLGGYESGQTDPGYVGTGRQPVSGLVTYDMEKQRWDKVPAAPGFNDFGTSIYGAAACAENFGSRGLFFSISGIKANPDQGFLDNAGNVLINTTVLSFYDVASNTWHSQQTTGDHPPARDRHCVAGVAGPNGTYEIYVYGGNDKSEKPIIKNDLYVLSLPGFVWFRADVESTLRSSHACIIPQNRQMIVVGGSAVPYGFNYTKKDEFPQGLGVFDLPTLSWKDGYDADAGPYEPPQSVTDWYNEGHLENVQWTNDQVKSLFVKTNNESTASPGSGPAEKAPSAMDGPVFVGVVGGVLGAGVVAGVVWYLLRWRRRRPPRAAPEKPPALLASPSYASSGGPSDGGYDPAVSQNYQHYAIELNTSESGARLKPHPEMNVAERPQELFGESRPQELPAWR